MPSVACVAVSHKRKTLHSGPFSLAPAWKAITSVAAGTVDPFHLHLPGWLCAPLPLAPAWLVKRQAKNATTVTAAGTVDPFHLHLPGRSSTKPGEAGTTKGFTEGMKLKVGRSKRGGCKVQEGGDTSTDGGVTPASTARILYVNPTSKEVGLSLLPHLIDMTLPSPVPLMGQVRAYYTCMHTH
eukprot:1159711-Pelagomonas_calceolata.AAC.11